MDPYIVMCAKDRIIIWPVLQMGQIAKVKVLFFHYGPPDTRKHVLKSGICISLTHIYWKGHFWNDDLKIQLAKLAKLGNVMSDGIQSRYLPLFPFPI